MTISAERIDAAIQRARQIRERQSPEQRRAYLEKLEELPPGHPWLQPEPEKNPTIRLQSKKK